MKLDAAQVVREFMAGRISANERDRLLLPPSPFVPYTIGVDPGSSDHTSLLFVDSKHGVEIRCAGDYSGMVEIGFRHEAKIAVPFVTLSAFVRSGEGSYYMARINQLAAEKAELLARVQELEREITERKQ